MTNKKSFILKIVELPKLKFFAKFFYVFSLLFCFYNVNAQLQNNGRIFVGNGAILHLASGSYNFGNAPSQSITTRTQPIDYGKLSFAPTALWNGATNAHSLDGYVRTFNSGTQFIFPVGQFNFFAPAAAIPTTANGVDAAYYRMDPHALSTTLDCSVSAISTFEYWDIRGANTNTDATISLTWRLSSDLASITNNTFGDLTIVGLVGTTWMQIPSTINTLSIVDNSPSTLTLGSITSNGIVDLSAYTAFSLGKKAVVSLPTITGTLSTCVGSNTQLTGSGTSASTNPYISSNPAVATVTSSGNVTGVAAGTTTITYTNNLGCSNQAIVTVNALPSIAGVLSICIGSNSQLTGSGTAASINPWVSSNPTAATVTSSGNVTGVAAGTTTITYTNTLGCSNQAIVTVNALPSIAGVLSICIGSNSQLTGSGTAATTNPWVSSNSAVATVNSSGNVTGVAAGTATITYTNTLGCSNQAIVTVNALPSIAGVLSICIGGNSQLTGSGAAASTNPYISSNPAVATVTSSGNVTGVTAGTTTITYTNTLGCSNQAVVIINPLPTVVVSVPAGCATTTSVMTAVPGTAGNYNYSWTTPAGATNPGNVSSFTATIAGVYSVIVTDILTTCSSQSASGTFITSTLPTATISGTATICANTSTTITFAGTPLAIVTYNINGSTNQTIVLDATGNASLSTGNLTATAVYNLVSVALGLCSQNQQGTATITVTLPAPTITTSNNVLCVDYNTNALLNGNKILDSGLSSSDYTFQWYLDGVLQPITTSTYTINTVAPGTYTVVAGFISLPSCSNISGDFTVIQSGPPVFRNPSYITSNFFSENHSIEVFVDGYGVYEYSLNDGPFQVSNVFENVYLGSYFIEVRDKNTPSCGSIVLENIQIIDYPHYFTPNGDGIHEYWNIIGLSGQPAAKIYIFDRYGKLLKQISPTGLGWDGTYNGNQMPSTDYWFTVDYEELNITKKFKGHFSLKR